MRLHWRLAKAFLALESLRKTGHEIWLDSERRIHVRPVSNIPLEILRVLKVCRREVVALLELAEEGRGITPEAWLTIQPIATFREAGRG